MFSLFTLLLALQTAIDARALALGPPQPVVALEGAHVAGEPSRLAWSPDGGTLYLQTTERGRSGTVVHHYLLSIAEKSCKPVESEPPWAALYWDWKSGQHSPASEAFKIDVEQSERTARATAAPAGGDLARGGGVDPAATTSVNDAASTHIQSQRQTVFTLRAKGTVVGEWVNTPVVPGVSFAWAPAPARVLAYTKPEGGPIALLDDTGHRQELTASGTAILPAWSNDGSRIAWVQRTDRKHHQVLVATIGPK